MLTGERFEMPQTGDLPCPLPSPFSGAQTLALCTLGGCKLQLAGMALLQDIVPPLEALALCLCMGGACMRANTAGMERAPSTTSAHQPLPLCRYPLVSTYNSTAVSGVLARCARAGQRCMPG